MTLTFSRIANKPQKIKTDKNKTQKPRIIRVGAFGYTLFCDTGPLGSFVEFIGCPQLDFNRFCATQLYRIGW